MKFIVWLIRVLVFVLLLVLALAFVLILFGIVKLVTQ